MNIRLNFVNCAQLAPNAALPTIVLFQRHDFSDGQVSAVAWKVIERCRPNWFHPVVLTDQVKLSTGDKFGNYSKLLAAAPGDVFRLDADPDGHRQLEQEESNEYGCVSVVNSLKDQAYDVCLFMRGQLFVERRSLLSHEQVDFALSSSLWVTVARPGVNQDALGPRPPGASRTLREGDDLGQRMLDNATEICLQGVASANIVMQGDASRLTFRREAEVWA